MKYALILIAMVLTACESSYDRNGAYYPGEYRAELNIGNDSTLIIDNTVLQAGDVTTLTFYSVDAKGVPVPRGGAKIEFQVSGQGSAVISNFVDNGDGSYRASLTAQRKGTAQVKVRANNKTLSLVQNIQISPGPIDVSKSNIFVSRINYLVGETSDVILTVKDSYENVVEDTTLFLYPTVSNGSSYGTFGGFTYDQGKYKGTFTASQEGTVADLKISIRNYGIVSSVYTVLVSAAKPYYNLSKVVLSKASVKVGQSASVTISIYDETNTQVDINNLPITFEIVGASQGTFSTPTKSGKNYLSTFTATQAGAVSTITVYVDGEYLDVEPTIQVVP